ncbi:LysR family transcriptional regulator [Neorhizobium sp. CSC1952]|uniref:LysR family transcriptional regulator n=1 Tax=Neorhizobium TaxID=1525371 RepID=UPI0025A65462|nr:LysR family transcriptional regulator [Rhizobium sp. CSC1952]WJR64995.1 LysR family transcriptional regulator [Rhizobium sp. CSC1952]
MNIGLRQLETFRLFARTQSVTETARLMRVSQPAVSQTLKELEGQFGFALFVRSNGRTRLTIEANNVLPEIERLFAQMASLRGKAEELKDNRAGALSIASVPSFTAQILPDAIKAFRAARSQVKIRTEVHTASDVVRQIRQEYCDIGFAFMPLDEVGVSVQPLLRMSMVCLVPAGHPLAGNDIITAADLMKQTIIVHGAETTPGFILRESLGEEVAGFQVLTTNQSVTSMHMAQSGLGIAFAHPLVLAHDPLGKVVAIPYERHVPLTFALLYSRNRPVSRIVLQFEAILRKGIISFSKELRDRGLESECLI